jgi:hypothetical protein
MPELKETCEVLCRRCDKFYSAVQSVQACPHCGTIQPSCEACSCKDCDKCKSGELFEEFNND